MDNTNLTFTLPKALIESIADYGDNASIATDTTGYSLSGTTKAFIINLRGQYVADKLRLNLVSTKPEDVTMFFTQQKVLEGQIALLTYLLSLNNYSEHSNV